MEAADRLAWKPITPNWRRDLALLALLLVLATGIRGWVVWCTEVPARDSIGFIRYALLLEENGWTETIRGQHQHPGYPLSVLAVSLPVRQFLGQNCDTMQLAGQLASALAGLLLVIPMYFLGRALLDRSTGFWGALLFQCLPTSGHILSDAVSDSLFLLLLTTALLFGLWGVRGRSPGLLALAGAFCGLTYLTRPEGLLVLPATGVTLLACQVVPAWRWPWRKALAAGTALVLAALVVGSPYFLVIGGVTNKPAGVLLAGGSAETVTAATGQPQPEASPPTVVPRVGDQEFIQTHHQTPLGRRMGQGAWVLGSLFAQSYQYVGWLPVVIGLWWFRRHYRRLPETWVITSLFILDALLLWLLAVRLGYLSNRYVLVLVLCTIFQAVAVVREVPYRLADWRRRLPDRPLGPRPMWLSPAAWSLGLLLILTGTGLSRTLHPLHANRAGHRAAGRWLAEHAKPGDTIQDDHCWAHYYAGLVFQESRPMPVPDDYQPKHYVVINRSSEAAPPSHGRPSINESDLKESGAHAVYYWPETGPLERARVVVYLTQTE
jgi:hypothetical protein